MTDGGASMQPSGNPTPGVCAILAAREQLPELTLDAVYDLYASTWLASHVRLLQILQPQPEVETALLLAHVLTRNPVREHALETWLPNCQLQPCAQDDIAQHIVCAQDSLAEDGEDPGALLAGALAGLQLTDFAWGCRIAPIAANANPAQPYQFGLTEQMCWQAGGVFCFLEVHDES